MATIKTYETGRGTRHCAEIVIRKNGKTLHRESKTFKKRTHAQQWADKREAELKIHGIKPKTNDYTIAELAEKYIADYTGKVRMGRSKLSDLKRIQHYPICQQPSAQLTSADYINHINQRLATGAQPQTVNNDLTWFSLMLKFGIAAHNTGSNIEQLNAAKEFLRAHGLIARPDSRERIPTLEEHQQLLNHFHDQQTRRSSIPMLDILLFAMYSARRQAEITRIQWADNDNTHKTGIVHDAKHPRHKTGNHRTFNYPPPAWEIAQQQPQTHAEIFPYNPRTVSALFTRACAVLEIKGLRFHDYRHLATTHLFVTGMSIQDVSAVTLHESWSVLKRYTHLDERTKATVTQIYAATAAYTKTLKQE